MTDMYKAGGAAGGALAGFFIGGPVGAVIGALGGYYAGGKLEPPPLQPTTTTLSLFANEQPISVTHGGSIGVLPPKGGQVISLSPAQNTTFAGTMSVPHPTQGIIVATNGGDINVTWRDPSGGAQGTILHVATL